MDKNLIKTKSNWSNKAHFTANEYSNEYEKAHDDPDQYWAKVAERIHWQKPWSKVSDWSFKKPVSIKWFLDAKLNITESCLDRHVTVNPHRVAFRWVPEDEKAATQNITYKELLDNTCRLANAMKTMGVKKGDRVTLYLPMVPEAVYSMLACARIGAVHSVIFAGFSPNSIKDRIDNCDSEWVITADEGVRGGKTIPLKANVDEALEKTNRPKKVMVVKRTGAEIAWNPDRDIWYHEAIKTESHQCSPEVMDSEDPLFILYTSGSTGKPKGVLHTTGGYAVYASHTHQNVFDYKAEDIYWCAADIGWITGHSYIVYGPLINGAESVLYEGLPTYPDAGRIWRLIDNEKVNTLYTAPTLIRALMREGEGPLQATSRSSLRILGSVGEPINPEAWHWYFNKVGHGNCPIVDTWWQTETGGIMISPLPGATDLKPGSASKPLFGIEPCLLTDSGEKLGPDNTGHLCIERSWPGQMRTVFGDHERFEETYFSQFDGYYYTGDECHLDKDSYYWIIGRADDVINVSGHRLGTAEVESSLVAHPAVAESAVVGFPHDIKGQGIFAFVTLKNDQTPSEELKLELQNFVKKDIGSIAKPDAIQWAPALPKTRSGKIMRRILRKIAGGDYENLGDTTTLADPGVVENLISSHKTN